MSHTKEWRKQYYIRKDHKHKYQLTQRKCRLKRCYGITLEQFEALWKYQDGKCRICDVQMTRDSSSSKSTTCCVDHDHKTKIVRGLICSADNKALGLFGDDPIKLRKAATYLENTEFTRVILYHYSDKFI